MFYSLLTVSLVILVQQSRSETISNHLKIALVELDPFVGKDSNGNPRGFLVDLMMELLDRVNTSGTQIVTYDTHWISLSNGYNETEMWDTVRQQLVSGEADLALVPLVDTTGWNGVVQLSQPYLLTPFVPLVSRRALTSGSQTGRLSVLEKLRKGQLKGLYVAGSSMDGLIENDQRPPIKSLRQSCRVQGNDSRVSKIADGVSRVRANSDQFVLFGEELRLKQYTLQAPQCDLTFDYDSVVALGSYSLPLSLFVQSQALTSSINMNLLKMRQDGTVARLKNKWWRESACGSSQTGIFGNLENYY